MPLTAGEVYYLKVRHYNAEWGTGAFTLGWERLADDDHGDDAESATPIETLPYEQAARFDWGRDFGVLADGACNWSAHGDDRERDRPDVPDHERRRSGR